MTDAKKRPPVLYEDAAVLVTLKPAGILSAPADGKHEKSLPELLSPDTPLYVVHRLDRPTAGVMVYAKTAQAAAYLQTKGEMEKTYLAVCEGVPAEKSATLSDLLFFDRGKDKTFVVKKSRRGVKEARLFYELLSTLSPSSVGADVPDRPHPPAGDTPAFPGGSRSDASVVNDSPGDCQSASDDRAAARKGTAAAVDEASVAPSIPLSLLRVTLDTGRTHQIRAQFASRRLPLVGDRRYGAKTGGTLALFAASLSFVHPTSGKRMTFAASMPDTAPFSDFQEMTGENEG